MNTEYIKKNAPLLVFVFLFVFLGLVPVPAQNADIQALEKQVNEARQKRANLERELNGEKNRTKELEAELSRARNRRTDLERQRSTPERDPVNTWGYIGVDILPYIFTDTEDDPEITFKPKFGFGIGVFSLDLFALVWRGNKSSDYDETETAIELRDAVLHEKLAFGLFDDYLNFSVDNYNRMPFYGEMEWDSSNILGLAVPELSLVSYADWSSNYLKLSFAVPVSYLPEVETDYRYSILGYMELEDTLSYSISFSYNNIDFSGYTLDEYLGQGYYLCMENRSYFDYSNYLYLKGDLHWNDAEFAYQVAGGLGLGGSAFRLTFETAYGDFYAPGMDAAVSIRGGIQINF